MIYLVRQKVSDPQLRQSNMTTDVIKIRRNFSTIEFLCFCGYWNFITGNQIIKLPALDRVFGSTFVETNS